jgi:tetratricopeptide (TPR) repeat protein
MLASLAGYASSASGQSIQQQARWCNHWDGASDDLAISGCTVVIQSGRATGPNLAIFFSNRGTWYGHKGQNDRALQDYNQAIRLKPDYADAYFNRGYTYFLKGQIDRAIQDYDQAIRINPRYALALKFRGQAKLKKGDRAGGNADIAKARQINPKI